MSEVKPPIPLEDTLNQLAVESRLQTCVIRVETVEDAKLLLDNYNTTNRPLSKSQYRLYANEMLRGKWQLNGEPLIFGVDDATGVESGISMQHRLHALIEAINTYNSTDNAEEVYPEAQLFVEAAVIYNVPIETADTVDQGMNRKHGHVLYRDEWIDKHISKEWNSSNSKRTKWCNNLAGAARLVWLRAGGATVSSAPKFIVSEMLEFIKNDHKDLCKFVSAVMDANEEEGAGLKISIPYIAALCYIASLDDAGKVHKPTMDTVLDAMLHIAQNNVAPGTAEHALVTYWNKMTSTPGSKDRDIDIVGPFVKALNAIIEGEKITAAKLVITKKEAETYKTNPPLLTGWDEACFIYAAEVKSKAIEAAEAAKAKLEEDREAAALQKLKEKEEKEAEKAKAKAEAEKAKEQVAVKPGVMSALGKAVKKANEAKATKSTKPAPNAGMPTKPPIKRKPVPAKS